jgi:hypothetical protein
VSRLALSVQSDGIGHGATFTLELPCQAKPDALKSSRNNAPLGIHL